MSTTKRTSNNSARPLCSVTDCGVAAIARGLCSRHYMRMKRNGGPTVKRPRRGPVARDIPSGMTKHSDIAKHLGVSVQRVSQIFHSKKHNARNLLAYAVKVGKVFKPSACEGCGAILCRIAGHHSDYDKPLDVQWLCVKCHKEVHVEARRSAA